MAIPNLPTWIDLMRKLKSCGVLVFRREPEWSFLLLKHPNRYDLPKGHVKDEESEIDCAMRELFEETGFSSDDVFLEEGFEFRNVYYPRYKRFGGERVEKTLVIFLGWLATDKPVTAAEHGEHEWVTWNPPHRIQEKSIDPLLAEVEAFFRHR